MGTTGEEASGIAGIAITGRPGRGEQLGDGDRTVQSPSTSREVALPTESVYCMTKGAISHLTRCLAVEWGRHGITVNTVAPTFIRTPGTAPDLANPAFRADVEKRIAELHRIGEPMDVAGAVGSWPPRPPR